MKHKMQIWLYALLKNIYPLISAGEKKFFQFDTYYYYWYSFATKVWE